LSSTTQQAEFVKRYGGVYEHSPWIAEKCWREQPMTENAAEIAAAMAAIVDASSVDAKLALIRSHPDLAGKLAVAGELTSASSAEQASAGLDQCSASEYAQFQRLNTAYTAKFDFPFIMAVRNSTRAEILTAFANRVNNTYEQEFCTAINEIHKIARLRLEQAI
jgi:OHCU decarboxylase